MASLQYNHNISTHNNLMQAQQNCSDLEVMAVNVFRAKYSEFYFMGEEIYLEQCTTHCMDL